MKSRVGDSQKEPKRNLTIALSARWDTYPDRMLWIVEHGFALEYSPNPEATELLPKHISPVLAAGMPVRYHAFLPGHEIGHRDSTVSESAMHVHLATLQAMRGHGQQVITMHVGLRHEDAIDASKAIPNLSKLVMHGRDLGITVCLENLRRGPTSHPENVVNWARESGAMITLDVGHAASCQRVQDGELSVLDFVDMFADRLLEVHMYEYEADRHYPPQDMHTLGPIVDRLLETQCDWWTIELDEPAEALATRDMLLGYLQTSRSSA